MKRLWKYLLGTFAVLLFAAAVIFYLVPHYLKQREIWAAQADLALLATPPAPPPSVKNGTDALWLLEYRFKDDAERVDLMQRFGREIKYDRAVAEQNQELQGRRLPDTETDAELLQCNTITAAECLAAVRSDLPKFRAALEKHADLFANIDRLADYDIFAPQDWPNDKDDWDTAPYPKFKLLMYGSKAALIDWAEGRESAAWQRVCRNIKTGRSLLRSRNGLIYPMVGNALIRKNTDLAAQMLYEQPEQANRLPAECDGMFEVLKAEEQNICQAVQDEFRAVANTFRKLDDGTQDVFQRIAAARLVESFGDGERLDTDTWFGMVFIGIWDAEHTLSRYTPYYAAYCQADKTAVLEADRKVKWQPVQNTEHTFLEKWACMGNSVGCIDADMAVPSYDDYVYRLQDTAMQQRAFQAVLELYRLPSGERRRALEQVLAKHSGPSRKLGWDEKQNAIVFERYQSQNNLPYAVKVDLKD